MLQDQNTGESHISYYNINTGKGSVNRLITRWFPYYAWQPLRTLPLYQIKIEYKFKGMLFRLFFMHIISLVRLSEDEKFSEELGKSPA